MLAVNMQGLSSTPKGIHALRAADIIEQLKTVGDYGYHGDPTTRIEGVQLGRSPGKVPNQFTTIVDDDWDSPTTNRLREQQQIDLTAWVQSATASGVSGFIASREQAEHPALAGQPVFYGSSAQDTFYRLTEVLRDSRGLSRISAITGSSGKTTTKRMLAHALRAAMTKGRVKVTPASFNVATEVAKHASRSARVRHSVVEVAGSAFPNFVLNGFALSPDVAIVTSIAEAHLDQFGTLENVARTKAHVFDRPPSGGTAIINVDTLHADLLVRHATEQGCQIVTYGESEFAGLRLLDYDHETGAVTARIAGETITYNLAARGRHMALNSLAVIAALRSYRLSGWRQGIESLSTFVALDGRGATHTLSLPRGGTVTLVDESYNANPGSMRVTIQAAAQDPALANGRVVLVLGDMLELGPTSADLHAQLAPDVIASGAHAVHLYGENMRHLYSALQAQGYGATHWDDLARLTNNLGQDVREGDFIIVKSSNGTGLKAIVNELKEAFTNDSGIPSE